MRIAISCDENPGDPGAVHSGIVERDLNIKVGSALEAALKRCGQDVWFDSSITYEQRVAKANGDGTQVLVACAHNAAGNPNAEGAQFLFCGEVAHTLGHQQAAADNCGRALVDGGLVLRYGTYDEEVYECCAFNGDTVYCEFAFETNPTDVATIEQPDYPQRAAELLAQGLARTYGFAYAPVAHDPQWKANLEQLPAPLSGVLAADVDVVNTLSGEKVSTLAQGAALTVAFSTRVNGVAYYMTQFSVEHDTGYAIAQASVKFEGLGDNPPQDPGGQPPDPNEGNTPSNPPEVPTEPPAAPKSVPDQLLDFADEELVALIEWIQQELARRSVGGA